MATLGDKYDLQYPALTGTDLLHVIVRPPLSLPLFATDDYTNTPSIHLLTRHPPIHLLNYSSHPPTHLFTYIFVHLFIFHLLIYSCTHLFNHLYIYAFIHLLSCSVPILVCTEPTPLTLHNTHYTYKTPHTHTTLLIHMIQSQ